MSNIINDFVDLTLTRDSDQEVIQKTIYRIVSGLSDGSTTSINVFYLLEKTAEFYRTKIYEYIFEALVKQQEWLAHLKQQEKEQLITIVLYKMQYFCNPDEYKNFLFQVLRPLTKDVIQIAGGSEHLQNPDRYNVSNILSEIFGYDRSSPSPKKPLEADRDTLTTLSNCMGVFSGSTDPYILKPLAWFIRNAFLNLTPIPVEIQSYLVDLFQEFADKGNIEGSELFAKAVEENAHPLDFWLKSFQPTYGTEMARILIKTLDKPNLKEDQRKKIIHILAKISQFSLELLETRKDLLPQILKQVQ